MNLFPKKKKIKKINTLYKNNPLENNNIIIPPKRKKFNLNQIKNKSPKISPKNYTFKTVFVNNFCVMPMNSSLIDNNTKNTHLNGNKKNNLNNSNRLDLTDRAIFTNSNNYNNSNYSINIKQEKNMNNVNKLIFHRKNQDNYKYIFNKNNAYINTDINSFIINKKKFKKKSNIENDMMNQFNNNKKSNNIENELKQKDFKENKFNENYYYTTMDLSKLTFIKRKNSNDTKNFNNANKDNNSFYIINDNNNNNYNNIDNNKKHIKFDLNKNILFFYNDKDYISKYQKISFNKNAKIRNLRKKIIPIIKKFNKEDIKIDNNYILKENLEENEILSKNALAVDNIF